LDLELTFPAIGQCTMAPAKFNTYLLFMKIWPKVMAGEIFEISSFLLKLEAGALELFSIGS